MTKMTNPVEDMANMFQQIYGDRAPLAGHVKGSEQFAGKMTEVSFSMAQQGVELSKKWTQDLMVQMEKMTTEMTEPEAFAQAMNDLATEAAKVSLDSLAGYADLVQNFQRETTNAYMEFVKASSESEAECTEELKAKPEAVQKDVGVDEKAAESAAKPVREVKTKPRSGPRAKAQ